MNRLPFFKAIALVIAFSKALTGIACLFQGNSLVMAFSNALTGIAYLFSIQ